MLRRAWLERSADASLLLRETADDGAPQVWPLPLGSVGVVMRRYGKPLDDSLVDLDRAERLVLGEGEQLARLRFRPRYDVIAKDYLVLETDDTEPVAVLATTLTAALAHLGRALAERES